MNMLHKEQRDLNKMKKRIIPLLALALLSVSACNPKNTEPIQTDVAPVIEAGVETTPNELNPVDSATLDSTSTDNTVSTDSVDSDSLNNTNISEEPAMSDRVTYQPGFYYESLSDSIKTRITDTSYPEDCKVPYEDLRYVCVRHYNLNGKEKTGELICNKAIAQDLVEIFYDLYQSEYPIEQSHLVDEYSADDELSMMDNNSSCFNYRVIAGTTRLSKHSLGMAVDINPFYNPYVTYPDGTTHVAPSGAETYADREAPFAFKITHDDPAYKAFTEHGFTWGGDWNSVKDYQHFEKD